MNQMHQYLQAHCQGLEDTISPDGPCPPPGTSPTCPWPRTSFPPLRTPPKLPMAQDPMSATWGHQPLPQKCCSKASLQLPRALPGQGPSGARPSHGPTTQPSLCPSPGRYPMTGAGAALLPPGYPLLAGVVDRPWLPDPICHPLWWAPSGSWLPIPKGAGGPCCFLSTTSIS